MNYAKYRNLFNNLKKSAKQFQYCQLLTTYRNDIRKTWGVINALIGRSNDKSSISETLKINNQDTTDHRDIAEGFCDLFLQILILNWQTKYHPQIQI